MHWCRGFDYSEVEGRCCLSGQSRANAKPIPLPPHPTLTEQAGALSCEKDSVTSPSYCTLADVGECVQADGTPPSGKDGWGPFGQVASVAECWERCEHGSQTTAVTFWPAGWEGWTEAEAKCRCHETCAAFNATLVNASHPSWPSIAAASVAAAALATARAAAHVV